LYGPDALKTTVGTAEVKPGSLSVNASPGPTRRRGLIRTPMRVVSAGEGYLVAVYCGKRERHFIKLMTSDHKLKASREGSK